MGVRAVGRVGRQRRVRMRKENRTEFRESRGATAFEPALHTVTNQGTVGT